MLLLVIGLLLVSAVISYKLLPKRCLIGERLNQATVFWNEKEAFVFLNVMEVGQAQNAVQRKIASSEYGLLVAVAGMDFSDQRLIAYHLLASGKLERPPLPQGITTFGKWRLVNGKLQLAPITRTYGNLAGFGWDGEKFELLRPGPKSLSSPIPGKTALSPDDSDPEDRGLGSAFLDVNQRTAFKSAGWHWKFLTGYEDVDGGATLPVVLGKAGFTLELHNAAEQKDHTAGFDLLAGGISRLELSGGPLAGTALWQQDGWHEIPKESYERRIQQSSGARQSFPSTIWVGLIVALGLMGWKVFVWGRLILNFVGVKGRVLRNISTSLSFPATLPAQFPLLDAAALERYTREFESMGFVRLLDTSPVSDAPNRPATFYRLLVHTGHHCFAGISQIFQKGKSPLPMKCAITSHLQDGWSIGFSDRKPLPGGVLIRRPKALAVSMPEAQPPELLQSFLTFRQQFCFDLGLSLLTNDTVEAYIANAQQAAADIKEAVKRKNFFAGVPQFYYRKLALVKTRPEYTWLGDYPKEVERRKQTSGQAQVTPYRTGF